MQQPSHRKNPELMKTAPYYSALVATLIFGAKIYGWFLTDSVAMLASLVDSMLDVSASVLNVFAMNLSLRPPDDKHRFGYDKIEDLAVFSQSIFFLASGLFALASATKRFFIPHELSEASTGINVMLFSIGLTVILLTYQNFVIKRTGSRLVMVDKLHYVMDLLTNLAVLISIYFGTKFLIIDTIMGFAIALYIIFNSYKMFSSALRNLIDQEFNQADKDRVISIISKFNNKVSAIHELKTRYAGNKPFIQFHMEVDGALSLASVHDIMEEIINHMCEEFPGAEVIIHADPQGMIEEGQGYRQIIS